MDKESQSWHHQAGKNKERRNRDERTSQSHPRSHSDCEWLAVQMTADDAMGLSHLKLMLMIEHRVPGFRAAVVRCAIGAKSPS